MTINEIMKYIESEYSIISNTPCDICGGDYLTEEIEIEILDDQPYDVCECVCSNCGHEKVFEFHAPFVAEKAFKKSKKKMN